MFFVAYKFYFKNTYITIFQILGCSGENAFQDVRAVSKKPFRRLVGSLGKKICGIAENQRNRWVGDILWSWRPRGHGVLLDGDN